MNEPEIGQEIYIPTGTKINVSGSSNAWDFLLKPVRTFDEKTNKWNYKIHNKAIIRDYNSKSIYVSFPDHPYFTPKFKKARFSRKIKFNEVEA